MTSLEKIRQPPALVSPATALNHLPQLKIETEQELKQWRTGHKLSLSATQFEALHKNYSQKQLQTNSPIVMLDLEEEVTGIGNLVINIYNIFIIIDMHAIHFIIFYILFFSKDRILYEL